MSTFRVSMIVLYTFLVTLAVILIGHTWSRATNPYFGSRITDMPAWYELGMSWFLLALAIVGAATAVLSYWALAHRKSWTRPLVVTIAWFTLFFYPGISILAYVGVTTVAKTRVPFFVMFDYKTVLLTVLSIAALAVWRSKRFVAEYASAVPLNRGLP